jgi:hypothetical protein
VKVTQKIFLHLITLSCAFASELLVRWFEFFRSLRDLGEIIMRWCALLLLAVTWGCTGDTATGRFAGWLGGNFRKDGPKTIFRRTETISKEESVGSTSDGKLEVLKQLARERQKLQQTRKELYKVRAAARTEMLNTLENNTRVVAAQRKAMEEEHESRLRSLSTRLDSVNRELERRTVLCGSTQQELEVALATTASVQKELFDRNLQILQANQDSAGVISKLRQVGSNKLLCKRVSCLDITVWPVVPCRNSKTEMLSCRRCERYNYLQDA